MARTELLKSLSDQSRRLATRTVLFHHRMADRLGLHATDLKCLDIINEHGQVAAGRLSELTGLTTGAITSAIDRLEKARLAKRKFDPTDRRKVFITVLPDRKAEIEQLFGSFLKPWQKMLSHYTNEQLTTILDYITEMINMHEEVAQKFKDQEKPQKGRSRS